MTRPPARRAVSLILGATVVSTVGLYVWHVTSYFFAFDDFVIIGLPSTTGWRSVFHEPLAGVYRPLGFALLKATFATFGWWPPIYIAILLILHACVAAAVGALLQRLEGDWRSAVPAAVCFLIAPWAAEADLWVAGGWDVLTTAGVVGAVLCGLIAIDQPDARRAAVALSGGLLSAAAALLSKETAVVTPFLFGAAVVARRGGGRRWRRAVAYGAGLVSSVAIYLYVRQRILPGFAGAYGTPADLLSKTSFAANLWAFVRSMVVLPLPLVDLAPSTATYGVYIAAVLIILSAGVAASARLGAFAAVSFIASIAPVIWARLDPGVSTNDRFLYLPGVWFAILFGVGIGRLWKAAEARWSPTRIALLVAPLAIVCTVAMFSLAWQVIVWREAFQLSKAGVEQMRAHLGSTRPIFISNLPSRFVEGQYVLREDSFRFYFQQELKAPVRARAMTLTHINGPIFSGWLAGSGTAPTPSPDEVVITLDLPITIPSADPAGRIEAPPDGGRTVQPFTVRGWALDRAAPRGTGVSFVQVWAYPESRAPMFIGTVATLAPRTDVASVFGSRFEDVEFQIEVSALPPGRCLILVYPHDTVLGTFAPPLGVTVTIAER